MVFFIAWLGDRKTFKCWFLASIVMVILLGVTPKSKEFASPKPSKKENKLWAVLFFLEHALHSVLDVTILFNNNESLFIEFVNIHL